MICFGGRRLGVVLNHIELNRVLGEKLQSGEPFCSMRIDNTAGFVMERMHRNINDFAGIPSPLESGVWPGGQHELGHLLHVYEETVPLMEESDILGFVDISGEISRSEFINKFNHSMLFFYDAFYMMDPGGLLGYSHLGPIENPWTKYLKGKKVVVVTSHAESVKHQWEIGLDKVWGNKLELIAPFELVNVIRAPYHIELDDRQYENVECWEDTVAEISVLLDDTDYDVLLSGATTMSPFLVWHAKNQEKVGIQTGGTLGLWFGLLMSRWTNVPGYSAWHAMYNEHWMRPLDIDKPQKPFPGESGFAYW